MELTPEDMAQRIDRAARQARQTDQQELRGAQDRYGQAARELRGTVVTVHAAQEQPRRLIWAAGGGLLAGCLLWAILPEAFVRGLPQNWHVPERMAAHVVGESSLWEAGTRIMRADNPSAWQAKRAVKSSGIAALDRKSTRLNSSH